MVAIAATHPPAGGMQVVSLHGKYRRASRTEGKHCASVPDKPYVTSDYFVIPGGVQRRPGIRLLYFKSPLSHKPYADAFNTFFVRPVIYSGMVADTQSTGRYFVGAALAANRVS
jgi:hypothetical protein